MLRKVLTQPRYMASGNLLLIAVARPLSLFAVITDKARLHQNGRDIGEHAYAELACSGRRLCNDPTPSSWLSTFVATSYPTRCE